MIFCFDIGNTSTTAALFERGGIVPAALFRFDTDKSGDAALLARTIARGLDAAGHAHTAVAGCAFASVVPEVNSAYHEALENLYGCAPLEIDHRCRLPIVINYGDPAQLGPDRIVNAAGVMAEYGGGCVIVDIGTAATFCVLLDDGTFDGGLIAPGVGTTIKALAASASLLPEIRFGRPDRLVARDTVNAIKSGFYYGWLSLVEGVTRRIEREYGRSFRLVMTGGYAGALMEDLAMPAIHDPLITMKGIVRIYELNRGE